MGPSRGERGSFSGGSSPPRKFADDDDRRLLARHVGGEPDAFGELFRRHGDRLWAVAVRTLGNPDDAADALQEAMISAFRRAGSYRGDAAVTTWLHRIVVNACLDLIRRRSVREVSPLRPDSADPAGLPDPTEAQQTRFDITAALSTLPPEQRVAVVLVDIEGYPVADVAGMLGIPSGTVKSRCARGRARLAGELAAYRNQTGPAAVSSTPTPQDPREEPER
ncbi:MAG: RNA polymerase sigma factor SigM [Frankiaceae bacterium]